MTNNIDMARRCLGLIGDIAQRGASSEDPACIGYAHQELSQVLFERTGHDGRAFEPNQADQISGLQKLLEELEWVDHFSQDHEAIRVP